MNALKTPYYSYDIAALRARMADLQAQASARGVKLFLAVKANPLSRILTTAAEAGFDFDVASEGELEQVQTYVKEASLILTGPAKSPSFLKLALERGVNTFVVESHQQLSDLESLSKDLGYQPQVLLRLQLRWSGADNNVLGGDAVSPFGLSSEDWLGYPVDHLEAVRLRGFHCFQWGNILDLEQLHQVWSEIGRSCQKLSAQMGIPFEILDVGGGLGIAYQESEVEPDWASTMEKLATLREHLDLQEIWMELGRYAVGPCGTYHCEVVDRKTVHGKELLVLEAGINHLLRPALIGSAFPCALARESQAENVEYQVHGPLCTALDCLGTLRLPADVQRGDVLIFTQCGAYGFTEAMPYFLCHALPAEVVVDGDKVETLRKSQEARDYLC